MCAYLRNTGLLAENLLWLPLLSVCEPQLYNTLILLCLNYHTFHAMAKFDPECWACFLACLPSWPATCPIMHDMTYGTPTHAYMLRFHQSTNHEYVLRFYGTHHSHTSRTNNSIITGRLRMPTERTTGKLRNARARTHALETRTVRLIFGRQTPSTPSCEPTTIPTASAPFRPYDRGLILHYVVNTRTAVSESAAEPTMQCRHLGRLSIGCSLQATGSATVIRIPAMHPGSATPGLRTTCKGLYSVRRTSPYAHTVQPVGGGQEAEETRHRPPTLSLVRIGTTRSDSTDRRRPSQLRYARYRRAYQRRCGCWLSSCSRPSRWRLPG